MKISNEDVKLCKECRKEASKTTCGSHYFKINRVNKVVVLNMQITKKEEAEEGEEGGPMYM
jgi:hypothetical protein